jgi:radical SAM superfamily enzyme YgiQ (UPF0313 family)
MKIGLKDVDSHNFPNLALMKISAYHKKYKHNVEFLFNFNNYDIVYRSKIFTWTIEDATIINADRIYNGGSGYKSNNILSDEIEHIEPDYDLYKCKHAYGFLTRGCIRKCNFCIVPKKEGYIKKNADIKEFIKDKKTAILLDNNVLAHEHGLKQIEKIINMGIKIDFNQGIDARLINKDIAILLSKVKWLKPIRMACDNKSQIKSIEKAVKLLRKYNITPKKYFIYILVKNIEDALYRINKLKYLNLDFFAQPYRDIENKILITKQQKSFCRWVNHKAIFKTVEWKNYKR